MCKCNAEINKNLADKNLNTVISEPYILSSKLEPEDSGRVTIETVKADKNVRKRPTKVFASFCPFCGQSYKK